MQHSLPLRLEQISKSFGHVQALHPLSLEVQPGEMLALLGPSGCGKTTTLRIVAGFSMPDTGSVYIGDNDVTELPPHKRKLGMVFQNYSLFPHMNVAENIAFGLQMRNMAKSEIGIRVAEMLRMVRLEKFADRSIHQLSGGQQQRVALARSLVTDPAILLLDEPLGALDKSLRESMQFELREIQKKLGITAIIVTHDQEEALTMSDRIAVMSMGRVVQIGAPIEIYQRPQSQFVSEFLGTANILPGEVLGHPQSEQAIVRLDGSRAEIRLNSNEAVRVGSRVNVALRPERMWIDSSGDGIPARFRAAVFRGSYYAYELDVQGCEKPVYVYTNEPIEVPSDGVVGLGFNPDYSILLMQEAA
ncbi:ABC transporter ATP-binding protein (plasmid) [Agrobacterium tumefaciens]|nr:ABC transporter ATP-binding protein [Agrobacterium tumefaciens]